MVEVIAVKIFEPWEGEGDPLSLKDIEVLRAFRPYLGDKPTGNARDLSNNPHYVSKSVVLGKWIGSILDKRFSEEKLESILLRFEGVFPSLIRGTYPLIISYYTNENYLSITPEGIEFLNFVEALGIAFTPKTEFYPIRRTQYRLELRTKD